MRPIALHPSSLLVGAGVALLAVVTMSQGSVTNRVPAAVRADVGGQPQAPPVAQPVPYTDYVFFSNGTAGPCCSGPPDYVVPSGKTLILTGILNRSSGGSQIQVVTGAPGVPPINTVVDIVVSPADAVHGLRFGPVHGYPIGEGEEVRIIDTAGAVGSYWAVGYLTNK